MKGQRGFPIRLVAARWLSASVRSLIFEPADRFEYRAGQSVQLTVPTKSGLFMRRPYSMASAPGALEGSRFEIAVTRVENGATSTALHALPIGAELMAEGPHGGWLSLSSDERGLRTLLVATGSGLAPLRALVQEQLTLAGPLAFRLLFGCRTTGDILWRDELDSWGLQPKRLSVEVTLSRPDLEWVGRTGYVQRHLDELIRELDPELILICGLSPMVDEVERRARELGVSGDAIRTEAYDR